MRNLPGIIILFFVLAGTAGAAVYRFIDKEGKVHYSDRSETGSDEVVEIRMNGAPVQQAYISYEMRRAMENFPVTLYTFPECGSTCAAATEFLKQRGIPFAEKSLTANEDIEAFRKDAGDSLLPAMRVGKIWLKGFQAERWARELDIAGYPQPKNDRSSVKPGAPAAP